jgi:hypothetical protein
MRRFLYPRCIDVTLTILATVIGCALVPAHAQEGSAAPTPAAAAATPPAAASPAAAAAPAGATPGTEAAVPGPGDIVDQEPFDETTVVQGKLDTNLQGVWLLVASAEVAKGKFKNFIQMFKVTKGKSGPEFHLLDVHFPSNVDDSIRDATRTLAAWIPSADILNQLSKDWSHLPPAKQKTRTEFLYGKIEYLIAASKDYNVAFPKRSEVIDKTIANSEFAMRITEDYRPRPASTKFQGAQVIRRTSYYGAKTVEKQVIKGDMITGFVAAGAGTPLPLDFAGTLTMYRLASQ